MQHIHTIDSFGMEAELRRLEDLKYRLDTENSFLQGIMQQIVDEEEQEEEDSIFELPEQEATFPQAREKKGLLEILCTGSSCQGKEKRKDRASTPIRGSSIPIRGSKSRLELLHAALLEAKTTFRDKKGTMISKCCEVS